MSYNGVDAGPAEIICDIPCNFHLVINLNQSKGVEEKLMGYTY